MLKYDKISDLIVKMVDEDELGNTIISKYVTYSQRENINKIEAYVNSKHISGEKDSLGRDKPFFNIVTAAINIWFRATDLDRKNVKVFSTKKADILKTFLLQLLLNKWMRKSKFGTFLNDWGRSLAKYGSTVVKFVEKGGELHSEVVPWSRLICDPVDFDNNPKIETLWLTPSQLRENKGYDQDFVEKLIEATTIRETNDDQQKDNKSDYIKVYEVHGNLSKYYLTEKEEDKDEFVQQMHAIALIEKKDKDGYDEHTLISGKEEKDPYMITHLIKEDDRTMSIGAVENLFVSQWMLNHNKKLIKDQLDLASKLIFQTSDGNFVGQNALSSIENGQILIHQKQEPLTQIANNSHDIGALQAYGTEWLQNANNINGIAESMVSQAKSGTAWRQTQAELQEAHSLFEIMVENKGLHLEDMLREFIVPHVMKKMDTTEEISEILDENQIKEIDNMYLPAEVTRRVNNAIKTDILNKTPEDLAKGNLFTPEMQMEKTTTEATVVQDSLKQMGSQRFIKPSEIDGVTWKKALKDFEWDVEVDITGESKDTQTILATLTTVFQTLASLQGMPMPPNMKTVFNKILDVSGSISPMEMQEEEQLAPPQVSGGVNMGQQVPA